MSAIFPWARFRETKGAVRLHTLLDLRGNIPSFIHISDGKLHEVNVLNMSPSGDRHLLHHGSWLLGLLQAPCCYQSRCFLRCPGQVKSEVPQNLFSSGGQIYWDGLRSIHSTDRSEVGRGLSRQNPSREILRRRDPQNPGVSDQQLSAARHYHSQTLQTTLVGGTLLQVDQTESAHQEFLRHLGERGEDPNLDCRFRLSDRSDHQKKLNIQKSLYTGIERLSI